jgi:hypothetical protein
MIMQTASRGRRFGGRGQMLVVFALAIFILMGIVAIVIDVSWYWTNSLRIQRAADAAALAGVVYLPGDVVKAVDTARAEAVKNGYTNGACTANTVCVTPVQDLPNTRRMKVTIAAPVNTFFMRVFGIGTLMSTRVAKAEYVLPVPMGSPQNYYGVGLFIDADTTGWKPATTAVSGGSWTSPGNANGTNDNAFALSQTNDNSAQQWRDFGLATAPNALPAGAVIAGIEVQFNAQAQGSGTTNDCEIETALSWNNGSSWVPTDANDADVDIASSEGTYEVGSATSLGSWDEHNWVAADFSNANFRVRLTWNKPDCGSGRRAAVDTLFVRVSYNSGPRPVFDPYGGAALAPQNFWGAMQSQGAPNIQGDAFMTNYESRDPSKVLNDVDASQDPDAVYDPSTYYNYGVEMPAGSTNGEIWVFDPGFCSVATSLGTGESWTVGGSNGNDDPEPVSAFYDVFNTKGTPYDQTDDGASLGSTGAAYRQLTGEDQILGGQNGSSDCSAATWHNGWVKVNTSPLTGGSVGTLYRLHTYSTDPSAPTDQQDTTALNSFAIWATAAGGTPRVYGNGAMEAYVRLPGGQASTFYLAQIESAHAGKTMVIDLWDPGDTGNLSASLEILQPTAGGYTPVTFSYQGIRGSSDSHASNCPTAPASAAFVVTNPGSNSSRYNGCWLRMTIVLPTNYTAPTPPGETEPGWWKIRYTMGGSTTNFSTDLTTWKVAIRGNPVHLVVP